ncbi:MAG: hypothetical protein JNK18_08935 [Cyclobacteriaceae bacterium]|nr:hypothetical protein [Cyclobacteriaceae bacterium]
MNKNFLIFLSCALLLFGKVAGQNIEISGIALNNKQITVTYNLNDSVPSNSYIIRVYSSWDGFTQPLNATGDVGLDIKTGLHRSFVIPVPADSLLNKPLSLEIRGRLFIPFINTSAINQYKKFKRQVDYNLSWTGGSAQNILVFDLYDRNNRKVHAFTNIGNAGHHTFRFPTHIRPGTYYFRISDSKNEDEVVTTNPFIIKRKVPLWLKAIPVLGAGSLAIILLSNSQSGQGSGDLPAMDKLPDLN